MNLNELSKRVEKCCKDALKEIHKKDGKQIKNFSPTHTETAVYHAKRHGLSQSLITKIITGNNLINA